MMEEKKKKSLLNDYKVIILILALTISIVAIPGYSSDEGFYTRLNYGLDIEGGSWVQLQLNGAVTQVDAAPRDIVAGILKTEYDTGINITGTNTDAAGNTAVTFQTGSAVNQTRLNYLFSSADVSTRSVGSMTEVTIKDSRIGYIISYLTFVYGTEVVAYQASGNAVEYEIRISTTQAELSSHMAAVNGTVTAYRDGTTKETMQTTIDVLNNKLGNGLGVKDLPIRSIGDEYILIDFAGVELNEARGFVETPGKFEIRIQTTGDESIHVLYGSSIEGVSVVGQNSGVYYVPFNLSEEGARALQQAAISTGATTNPDAHQLMMLLDDVVVYSAPLSPDAAARLRNQLIYNWQASTGGYNEARQLQIHLRAGALPVNVNIIGSGQVEATLGQGFLKGAIITALFTMIAVALLVYNRYRKPEIVLPMIATSFSEVIMLLGLSVLIRQQLDLAAIAGIIAVIGTGIDHLVIITEEVVHEGKAPSGKIYAARIGKAFVIIFAAAATTVVAMSPLLFLGFGALKGFAIVTILGVFIGVLIARPAYAVILKYILTEKGMINEKITE